jgi:hypothetical protein
MAMLTRGPAFVSFIMLLSYRFDVGVAPIGNVDVTPVTSVCQEKSAAGVCTQPCGLFSRPRRGAFVLWFMVYVSVQPVGPFFNI